MRFDPISWIVAKKALVPKNISPSQLGFDFEWLKIGEFSASGYACGISGLDGFKDKIYMFEMEIYQDSGGYPYENWIYALINEDSNYDNYNFTLFYTVNGDSGVLTKGSSLTFTYGTQTVTVTYTGPLIALYTAEPSMTFIRGIIVADDYNVDVQYPIIFTETSSGNSTDTLTTISTAVRFVSENLTSILFESAISVQWQIRLYKAKLGD